MIGVYAGLFRMSANDLELARRFHEAMDGSLEELFALLCDDVEWVTDRRTLRGLAEMQEKLNAGPREGFESLDREYEVGEWEREPDGVVTCRSRITLRWKESGEVATASHVREAVTFRDGKILRYERRMKWE